MYELEKKELLLINGGGFNLSGTVISGIVKGISTIFEIGQRFGSALRRIQGGTLCPA